MSQKKKLVIVGDSYGSQFETSPLEHDLYQGNSHGRSWIDVVQKELNLEMYCFGFVGKSWYYSYSRWQDHIRNNPRFMDDVEVLIFIHTDSYRYNTVDDEISVALHDDNFKLSHPVDPEKRQAYKFWMTFLQDGCFQSWAQTAYLKEITERYSDSKIKIFQFFVNPQTLTILPDNMCGIVYTTPLIHISLGEIEGTDEEVTRSMWNDRRANHFSYENNQAFGRMIIEDARDYKPCIKPIDTSRFILPNPNASRWPEEGFGTR